MDRVPRDNRGWVDYTDCFKFVTCFSTRRNQCLWRIKAEIVRSKVTGYSCQLEQRKVTHFELRVVCVQALFV